MQEDHTKKIIDGRQCRRRRTRKSCPAIARAMKLKWQDPEYRAKMDAYFAKRRADPIKSWSRRGIFDGYTRAEAEVYWGEAREKARKIMRVLKSKGLLAS